MGKRRLLSLTATFLLCIPGLGLCEGNEPGCGRGTCATIAAILAVYPPLEVHRSEEPVRDFRTGVESPGCRILVSGPAALLTGEVDPAEAVRLFFHGSGWEEDIHHTADGPGITSFAFRKDGMVCQLRGGAHSWIEDGKTFTSERYELEAGCVSQPD